MEPDQDERDTRQSQAAATPASSDDGGPVRANSSPPAAESQKRALDHDSLVTVRLSEPPSLYVNTSVPPNTLPSRRSLYGLDYTPSDTLTEPVPEEDDGGVLEHFETDSPASDKGRSLQEELEQMDSEDGEEKDGEIQELQQRSSSESDSVKWDELQKTEDSESREQDSDHSTALLLAKLDQENNKIAKNPKSFKVKVVENDEPSSGGQPRPPSMAQLRKMVHGPTPSALRYSVLPPPPMTDLEFYLALVKDPQQTAARLPTLLSNKIRRGVPPPLRGVVWQSMAGARDGALEEIYDRLSGESSPYEGIIGKDIGRSFPGVDMFRDPEGDGQRMLARVLKCFSLYDTKIGYCQGLGFLVGPLLMHMPDKPAFCVLVRLMENYDLRHCFVPDLSGLHVRIYQFRELLREFLPTLSAHLDDLQVDPAYVSQWFLSFFAVTCPLPMLFRIYDVIFAEGASETIMRVALSLMRKNQARILASTEMEDVMHLLLSRGLWDCYHYSADEFVEDFVNLSGVVTKERMAALERGYREAKINSGANSKSTDATQVSDVTTAASRFLGRLWASSTTTKSAALTQTAASAQSGLAAPATTTSNTLSPGLSLASRPLSMLRRSTSKQSLASTLNSMEVASLASSSSGASDLSAASTDATSISRDSSADDLSREPSPAFVTATPKPAPTSLSNSAASAKSDSKYLHSQIEDLLTVLGELQRNHSLLASQLQREREEREEDRRAVRSLLDGLRIKASTETAPTWGRSDSEKTITRAKDASGALSGDEVAQQQPPPTPEQLSDLLEVVEGRFGESAASRRSSVPQTKLQLRDELARAKEQLSNEMAKTQDSSRRLYEMEHEVSSAKEQLRESHAHVRNLHQEKQRLEKQIQGLRTRASDTPASNADNGDWFSKATGMGGGTSSAAPPAGGLRELKLGRSRSTPSQTPALFNKRASSVMTQKSVSRESSVAPTPAPAYSSAPVSEYDSLLLELAQAKTGEAVAKQEAEEAKQRLEKLRKAFGLAPGETPPAMQIQTSTAAEIAGNGASAAASAAINMFGRLTGSASPDPAAAAAKTLTPNPTPAGGTTPGGFWGWRR
ncbi:rab-GTPase-TBC domain-containing protein [Lasiosphaeria miniovina]|uniref:Rab-GTPase-TBC domain-containing protein n=1 Tax=Lasiosphaeria miniovina TaxID=1954250 RepID=A0AA39ZQG7_9PEZI|nr:rab-GTPase-TBC domain-containing protein [Lasiosphaeria miniovina]KAK0701792.1 rab-GTPase-TBC domain-containing protein [Lasiosphaeria miniovina]